MYNVENVSHQRRIFFPKEDKFSSIMGKISPKVENVFPFKENYFSKNINFPP
jgi:hypothetical protein